MGDYLHAIKFINPQTVIDQLGIGEGARVADFGCGSGYFSLELAKRIGDGTVYAFDIVPARLEAVVSQAKNLSLTNIITERVNLEKPNGSKLPEKSVDWVILKDMLFQNQDKDQILSEAKRVLKDGGKILIIEWKTDTASLGPDKKLRISKEAMQELARKAGLQAIKDVEAGNFHYGMVLAVQ